MYELRDQKSSFKIIADQMNTLWEQGPVSLKHSYSLSKFSKVQKNDFYKNVITYNTEEINAKIPRD